MNDITCSKTETVEHLDEIRHDLVRKAMKMTGVEFIEKSQNPLGNLANGGIYITMVEIFSFMPETTDVPLDRGFDVLPAVAEKGMPAFGTAVRHSYHLTSTGISR
jgi:NDP-sugar pyrophosphorylase family protein